MQETISDSSVSDSKVTVGLHVIPLSDSSDRPMLQKIMPAMFFQPPIPYSLTHKLPCELRGIVLELNDELNEALAQLKARTNGPYIDRMYVDQLYADYSMRRSICGFSSSPHDLIVFCISIPAFYPYIRTILDGTFHDKPTDFEKQIFDYAQQALAGKNLGDAHPADICLVHKLIEKIDCNQLLSTETILYILAHIHSGEALYWFKYYYQRKIIFQCDIEVLSMVPQQLSEIFSLSNLRALEVEMHYCRYWIFDAVLRRLSNLLAHQLLNMRDIAPDQIAMAETHLRQYQALALWELFYLRDYVVNSTEPHLKAMKEGFLKSIFNAIKDPSFSVASAAVKLNAYLTQFGKVLKGEAEPQTLMSVEQPHGLKPLIRTFKEFMTEKFNHQPQANSASRRCGR